ncbi:MAG TPA: CocE/NonD family hydrolase [Candidatus Angelobacter sp.]|nr:CocE/NonD family hydrolase [Candidatus Angelobacter sp.]
MFNLRNRALWAARIAMCGLLASAAAGAIARAQDNDEKPGADAVKAHYTKYEFRIPMRDGAHLFTSVYVPKDAGGAETYPFLIQRTPYSVGPYGADNYRKHLGPAAVFEKDGFIFVYQDVRGRFMSEGTFVEMTPHKDVKRSAKDVDESTDAYDTIDWLVKNVPRNNGKAGLYGISYPGFFVAASMIDSHPALKACSPQAPVTDLYMGDDAYHNGAFMLDANFGFYTFFKPHAEPQLPPAHFREFDFGTNDAYEFYLKMGPIGNAKARYLKDTNFYWDDQVDHPTYDDFWKSRNIAAHLKNVHCAVMTVGGLFDAEDIMGPHRVFRAVSEFNPGTPNMLVEGPWFHGGWAEPGGGAHLGPVNFAAKNSDYFNEEILLPFFREYLKDGGDAKTSEITIFETGTNVWRRYDSWPPKNIEPRKLYFGPKGRLSFDAPKDGGFDEYTSDPAKPVPFVETLDNEVPREYMTADQRFAAKRPDVLVYQTEPLEVDITVAGEVSPQLWVSSSGTDSDFDVKLIDVYPMNFPDPQPNPKELHMGGYEQLVRGEPFRAKYRNSFEKPEALTPNQPTALNFSLPSVNHTFRRGHRIMVQIQSTWFPLTDRNPQKFVDISKATEADFQKATERVYRGGTQASSLLLPVLK